MIELNIIVADDHPVYRTGMRLALEQGEMKSKIYFAENGKEVINLIKKHAIHVVIMDIHMPQMDGIEATRVLMEINNQIKVIALSGDIDRLTVLKMLRAGAVGYISKKAGFLEILKALHRIMEGKKYYSEDVIEYLLIGMEDTELLKNHFKSVESISIREAEIIRLIALGYSNKEISNKLFISLKTIEAHKTHIFNKLKIKQSIDLIFYAIDRGLIKPK